VADLQRAETPIERFSFLGRVAKDSLEEGQLKDARRYILELQSMLPDYTEADPDLYWGAVSDVNIALGRLAIRDGDVELAKQFLVEAAKLPSTPTNSTFGPKYEPRSRSPADQRTGRGFELL
jgi:hypothetical protein